jgi:hypothetical protein
VSGSNCCDPGRVFLFPRNADGSFAARREVRLERPGVSPIGLDVFRGRTRPHLLDWKGDGHTDLVVGYPGDWSLYVTAGPLAGKTEVAVKPFPLPAIPHTTPWHFAFADWDGDGRSDLLVAVSYRQETGGPKYDIYWFRNTSAKGEPAFAAGRRLLTIAEPWELNAFAVVDRNRDGRSDVVVSLTRGWTRKEDGGWSSESQLWRYRRRAEPAAAPSRDRHGGG